MTKSEVEEQRSRIRGWLLAIAAIAAWLLLATNSADAHREDGPHPELEAGAGWMWGAGGTDGMPQASDLRG
ncbi:MAG: hypothetical protein CL908_03590 [Deltaproteobacteria bacterium]|nr:hypothetical protein [Deltaproteobacteria bacterium]